MQRKPLTASHPLASMLSTSFPLILRILLLLLLLLLLLHQDLALLHLLHYLLRSADRTIGPEAWSRTRFSLGSLNWWRRLRCFLRLRLVWNLFVGVRLGIVVGGWSAGGAAALAWTQYHFARRSLT